MFYVIFLAPDCIC